MDQNQQRKPTVTKPVQPVQPFRTPNSTPNSNVAGRDKNFNLNDGKTTGQQSVAGSQVNASASNQKPPKKQRSQKKQRTMASGSNDGSNGNDEDKAEDQMGVQDTYADYKPAKLKIGAPHPDAVVETATLSSIEPNDITYELSIPKSVIEKGSLSALQLESIVYASQAHEKKLPDDIRAGFLIGMNSLIVFLHLNSKFYAFFLLRTN